MDWYVPNVVYAGACWQISSTPLVGISPYTLIDHFWDAFSNLTTTPWRSLEF